MDAHVAGKNPKFGDLHIHKKTNRHNNSIEVKIPVNPDKEIQFKARKGDRRTKEKPFINEVKKEFKKQSEEKMRHFAKEVIEGITKYDEVRNKPKEEQKDILRDYAERLAGYFDLPRFRDVMAAEIDNKIQFLLTSHADSNNKLYYIKQDIIREYITIGDDLEELFYRNEKHCDPDLFD
jgi:tRNA pseudouridine-54 N-methylase